MSNRHGLMYHLGHFLEDFFGRHPEPQAEGATNPQAAPSRPGEAGAGVVGSALDESLEALEASAQELRKKLREEEPNPLVARPDPTALAEAVVEQHKAIAEAVLAMHQKLGTGLGRERLTQILDDFEPLMSTLAAKPAGDQGGVLERLIFHVSRRIFRETGRLAWARMLELMEKAQVSWPEPSGVSPSSTAEERKLAAERSRDDAYHAFVQCTPEQAHDWVWGIVKVWRQTYPTPNSGLWMQLCFDAVASAMRLELYLQASRILESSEGEEIKDRLREVGRHNLDAARALAKEGINSLAAINEVLESTNRFISMDGPSAVWNWLKPRVGAKAGAPT